MNLSARQLSPVEAQCDQGQLNVIGLLLPRQEAAKAAQVEGIHHNIHVTDHSLRPLSLLRNRQTFNER